ncbi:MAG: tRNA (adenosine(37)-N6)-threonylcarbamoyltransferase complex ATPase subunit type 1 TsaE [Flavobacteriales bacterium]
MKFEVEDISGLAELSKQFVNQFHVPAIFAVHGEMGAGKTTFIKAICNALGAEAAASPTYSLVNEYVTDKGTKIFHFDLYRLKNLEEVLDFGFDEYLDQHAFIFIEWPEVVLPMLDEFHKVQISSHNNVRFIEF